MCEKMYRSSPFPTTLNTSYITGVDMCEVCTEAVHCKNNSCNKQLLHQAPFTVLSSHPELPLLAVILLWSELVVSYGFDVWHHLAVVTGWWLDARYLLNINLLWSEGWRSTISNYCHKNTNPQKQKHNKNTKTRTIKNQTQRHKNITTQKHKHKTQKHKHANTEKKKEI